MAIMMDLHKAYQAIHTSATELHLRHFFYLHNPGEMEDSGLHKSYVQRPGHGTAAGSGKAKGG